MQFLRRLLTADVRLLPFVCIASVINFLLYHYPFFRFVFQHIDYRTAGGVIVILSLVVLMLVANAFVFFLVFYLSRRMGKLVLILFFLLNAISVYFVNTYGVIIDEDMIGNVLNTKYSEASSFFSLTLVGYTLLLGVLPGIYIGRMRIEKCSFRQFLAIAGVTVLFMALMVFANAKNWLWIDKNSKQLGGLAMPWSYTVNLSLHYAHQRDQQRQEVRLPDATITDTVKSVVVLVIGESARKQNFSLYGYSRNTNPLLSKTPDLFHFDAKSCATYTTAGVKCILEYADKDDLYEILPNYLERSGVEVIWRTTNWGEPPVHIRSYQTSQYLQTKCKGEACGFDELLLTGLREQILASTKKKILIVLHTSTSHGPSYSKKYPSRFQVFSPVCNSVELGNCSQQELYNAYDNTIVYTDYILHNVIDTLKQLDGYKSAMLFVSDHGESLGEKNLYMHGVPMSFAPKEQYEIPFILWRSDSTLNLKAPQELTQHHVFHSVLRLLSIQSPVYNEALDIFR